MVLAASSHDNILSYMYVNKMCYKKANLLLSREFDND
jgi:hypothetical protein